MKEFNDIAMDAPQTDQDAFTVQEITRLIKQKLESGFQSIWIRGEISNFKRSTAGHLYFTLKDKHAQISIVMFRFQASKAAAKDLKQGVAVRVYGDISVYDKAGNYQLICTKLEPEGFGELQMRFLKLKEDLFKAGWFETARKKKLPFIPNRIGIVTSPTGAVIRDMLNTIIARFPGMPILLYPAKVQGPGAKESIAEGIAYLNRVETGVDVIIVGRGGGSLEDLWAFNEKLVAEAIYASRVPIVSAVGHEIDFTIADFVADSRAETPTAAGVLVVPERDALLNRSKELQKSMADRLRYEFENLNHRLKALKMHHSFRKPENCILQIEQRMDELRQKMSLSLDRTLKFLQEKCLAEKQRLHSLSPYQVLGRGYAMIQDSQSGKVVGSIKGLKKGRALTAVFSDGAIETHVEKVLPSKIKK
jgi:exodeoxyribonuclease VII large subunit